jgi:hypothetical protein
VEGGAEDGDVLAGVGDENEGEGCFGEDFFAEVAGAAAFDAV